VSAAREEILDRVRTALRGAPPAEPIARAYRRVGTPAPVELLAERVGEYRAEVLRLEPSRVRDAIAHTLGTHGAARVGIPPGLPDEWRPDGVDLVEDHGLSPRELDALDGVVTGCTLAIAETGTLVLAGGASEGRRALTLVPDLHVCVVREEQVVELVPEAFDALGPLVLRERRPITLVSGPSATSDIELKRVEGVHGPRRLVVLIA
jgi:L-lactate dehydrogenase complex protein LldG